MVKLISYRFFLFSKRMSVSQEITNVLFDVKEKLTDEEYINLMNLCKKLNIEEKNFEKYNIQLAYPIINTIHESNSKVYKGTIHKIDIKILNLNTQLTKCNNNAFIRNYEKCELCSSTNVYDNCINLTCVKENLNSCSQGIHNNIDINTLIATCPDEITALRLLKQDLLNNSKIDDLSYSDELTDDSELGFNEAISHNEIYCKRNITIATFSKL